MDFCRHGNSCNDGNRRSDHSQWNIKIIQDHTCFLFFFILCGNQFQSEKRLSPGRDLPLGAIWGIFMDCPYGSLAGANGLWAVHFPLHGPVLSGLFVKMPGILSRNVDLWGGPPHPTTAGFGPETTTTLPAIFGSQASGVYSSRGSTQDGVQIRMDLRWMASKQSTRTNDCSLWWFNHRILWIYMDLFKHIYLSILSNGLWFMMIIIKCNRWFQVGRNHLTAMTWPSRGQLPVLQPLRCSGSFRGKTSGGVGFKTDWLEMKKQPKSRTTGK